MGLVLLQSHQNYIVLNDFHFSLFIVVGFACHFLDPVAIFLDGFESLV